MFSSIMETVLVKFLGKYVDGIKNNMDISLITGNATIQKISLRPQFINQLGLPFVLKYSHISKILINVPWANLKQKPTTVTVQGIYVLLSLKYDDMEQMYIDPQKKMKSIVNRVKEEIKKKWEEKQSNKSQTFAQKSIIRIIDNLVVSIDQIHVRVESMKRNWDFSFGVIIDKISSFTVSEYGQKTFYTRHFTNKQLNAPLRKSFTCERFDIYFNDKQDFFMSEKEDKNKNQAIKTLLMQPFQSKYLQSNSPKKKQGPQGQKALASDFKQSYKTKILSRFSFDIIAEQKLSVDKKYIVEIKGQLPKVCFSITDLQLSQILVVCELIYEWVIDKEKNGRKNFNFDEKTEAEFKKILLKLSKEQKISNQQMENLFQIASQTPVNKLENSADNLIREYRIEKEMKKINKAANKDRSKQMIEKLLQRIQNENQQVMELFQHIIIEISLPQFKLSCMKNDHALFQIGLNSIFADIKLVLTKHTLISINISQPFIKQFQVDEVKQLILLNNQQYMKQPFFQFGLTLLNKSPPIIKASLKKRYIELDSTTLHNLLAWVACIKLKPPLVNFLDEQLNYSIHITQQIFNMLFLNSELSISINLQIPVLGVHLGPLLEINWGTMLINRESEQQYCIEITEKQTICIDDNQIMQFKQGNKISLLNIKPQTVKIQLCHIQLQNIFKVIKFVGDFVKNPILKQIKKLDPISQEEIIFEGKFILNQYITPQNMLLRGNYLKFLPSGQSVYLLRSKMYPFMRKNQFGLIFREQVQKTINIVLMDSQKLMYTLFQTIKQHMLYICTISQWKKYYQKFPCTLITEVSQIQTQQQNVNLIDLHIILNSAEVDIGTTKLGKTLISCNQFKGTINYKEYNTDAKGDIGCFNLSLGKQKLIENLAIGAEYSYKDWMGLLINVTMFKLNIDTYQVIQQILNLSAQYSNVVNNLIETINKAFEKKQQNYMLQKVSNEADISYLLESKISIRLSNIETMVIGFRNMLKSSQIEISKYRNSPIPFVLLRMRQVVLMSSITLGSCQLSATNSKIQLTLNNLAVYLSFQLLFYELTTGRGNMFLNSLLNLVEGKQSNKIQGGAVARQRVMPTIDVKLRGFKSRFRLIEGEEISFHLRSLYLNVTQSEENKQKLSTKIQCNKLKLLINNNIILEPLSGVVNLSSTPQFMPLHLTISLQSILINISIHKLIESITVIRLSLQRILSLELVRSLINQNMNVKAKNPRLVQNKNQQFHIFIHIDSVKVILYNSQDWQLLRLRIEALDLDTQQGKNNQIQLCLQHLNYGFRIYEPVIEKTKISMCMKQGPQACIKFHDIRFNLSQQFVKDIGKELILTKQGIRHSLKNSKFHIEQLTSVSNEIQKHKSIIISMILPEEMDFIQSEAEQNEEGKKAQNLQQKSNMSILQIRNHLKTQVLVQVKIDQKKTQLHLKLQNDEGEVTFKVRPQYKQSYEMVEKYKQVLVKLSLIHPNFYTQSLYFSVFLHKRAYTYHPCTFNDDSGQQLSSCIGLFIHQQQNSINYIMDIISPFKVVNKTAIQLNLNWIKGEDHYYRQLKQGEDQWVSPWVSDKVTINPNSDHLFASSFQIFFQQPHGLYEISLSNMIGNETYNYCCLTVERELFQLQKWNSRGNNTSKKQQMIRPATMVIKPTYFIINHLHCTIYVNQIQCTHKKKVPLYSMFRTKKSEMFFKLKLGDGSMHEIYLPKQGQTNSVELKLNKQNYVTISILRQKSLQGTGLPNENQCVYHLYAKLELLISLPKMEELTLKTNILSTRYILKKQIQINETPFELPHPTVMEGAQFIVRDRFNFHTYVHVLDEFEKYLEIKSSTCFCKQVTLYPSYYGNDLPFYPISSEPQQQSSSTSPLSNFSSLSSSQQQALKPVRKYCINYEYTKISNDIVMFYVSILPKYYILNLSSQIFNIEGQGGVKFNERIVVDSDQVQITLNDSFSKWNMLHNSLNVNLGLKNQIVFFRGVLFREHQINQQLKNKRRRKSSQDFLKSSGHHNLSKSTQISPKKQQIEQVKENTKKITISTQNIRVFHIIKHIGSCSATTFCISQWNQWVKIHNNLNKTIVAVTSYLYVDLQINIQTVIQPGQVGNHPYGIQNLSTIQFFLQDSNGHIIELGRYQNHLRFNDQIQLTIPQENPDMVPKVETIVMYEVKASKGRKVIFSFASSSQQSIESNKKIRSLILPAFLRLSESLKVTIENINASIVAGLNRNRKQLIRVSSRNVDFLLLAYPSGLYIIQLMFGLQLQAPQFPELVLNVPNIQFYLQAVQQKFIECVTVKIPKQMTVFLTDKLIYEIADVILRNIKFLTSVSPSLSDSTTLSASSSMSNKKEGSQGFYTSNLNSVFVSDIQARVTVKKMFMENRENQQKLLDMGLSIIQLENSLIKLSKINIEEPVNAKHISKITKAYIMEIVMGCLGGMNLIGNPKQFMQEIQAGTSRGKPVVGFVGGVLAGTANSMSKILSTVSNSVSQLSMDSDYQRQRNQNYMNQPKGFANGVKQGSKSLFSSVKSGVVGLYAKPKQGLSEEGGIGLLKGTFQGLAGMIIKSVTGVIDAASMTVRGIKSASSYSDNPLDQTRYLEKPLYHKFKIIRSYDKIDEIVYNSLVRIFRQKGENFENVDIVEGCILEDEHNKPTQEAVIVTSEKLYVINYADDTIDNQIPNDKMNATGKFLEGVVLYFNEVDDKGMDQNDNYDNRDNGEEIVFRVASNPIKKERLYSTLKAFVDLYSQSKDKEEIPE